ncbi:MAG TPA: sulfite reductase flavoprotein subunit alpha, partial [Opitutaceae bacterium]
MPTVPYIPDNAPFSAEQRAWLNGFFAGLFSRSGSAAATAPMAAAPALVPLTILFGSQTGTCEGLAKRVAKEAGKRNFAATELDMAACDAAKLATEKNLLVIVSTYGDGEPPDSAKTLHAQLAAGGAKLSELRYSVCALGDTNYTQFCKCGADFDTFLEKAGATRVSPRVDCDVEYEEKFAGWLTAALGAFGTASAASTAAPTVAPVADSHAGESGYSRTRPYASLLLTSRNLNGVGSAKQVHHVEFDLTGSGLTYEAGDALGVVPHNCPALVTDVLTCLGCDGEEAVTAPDGTSTSLRRALTELYDLGKPTAELLALFPATVPASQTSSSSPQLATPHHVIDVLLARADLKPAPADFVRALKKIQPRLYSISSSPRAHAGQVHLTVGAVRYDLHGRPRKGVCSTFLADSATPGTGSVG